MRRTSRAEPVMSSQIKNRNQGSYDAVVVGGGVIGQAITLELARSGIRVLLIYPRPNVDGTASPAAGAMLGTFGEITADQNHPEDLQELNFRIQSRQIYPSWLESLQEASGLDVFTSQGTFIFGNNAYERDRANLKRIKKELDSHKEAYEWVEPEDVPGFKAQYFL